MAELTDNEIDALLANINLRWRPIPKTSLSADPEEAQLVVERITNRSAEKDIESLSAIVRQLRAELARLNDVKERERLGVDAISLNKEQCKTIHELRERVAQQEREIAELKDAATDSCPICGDECN